MIILPRLILGLSIVALPLVAAESSGEFDFESRAEIPAEYKWDLTLMYSDWETWEKDLQQMEALFNEVLSYKGRLAQGPDVLLESQRLFDEAQKLSIKVLGYVYQLRDLDTRDNAVQARVREAQAVSSRVWASLSWFTPELLEIPRETVASWIDENPGLEPYAFDLMDTYRVGEHVLDAEAERLLRLHSKVRGTASDIYSALTNADVEYPEVVLEDGSTVKVSYGVYSKALNTFPDPTDRKRVQEAWMKQFEDRSNTFASIYNGVLQKGWALAESRDHEGVLEMELNEDNVPREVVETLVEAARSGKEEIRRYHLLRKELLALDSYGWSDMHIPLVQSDVSYAYDSVVPMIVDSVAVLGEEYHRKMAEQFEAGYVDVFETPGKRTGAYNTGRYGIGSFVLLNYKGTLDDVFTVAHEMGHSMHTRLSQEYQPFPTHYYTIFVAEVASIFNEKLLLEKLLERVDNPRERVAFLERQINAIHSTFFLQTMMADFEMQAHEMVENGEGITADKLTGLWRSVVSAYFADVIPEEDPYYLSWARIPHLYRSPFYVYKYATCYASAAHMMKKMEKNPDEVVDQYLTLLKSGGSDYPMEQLRKAGVDLTRKEILDAVVEEFAHLVDLLEIEYSKLLDEEQKTS